MNEFVNITSLFITENMCLKFFRFLIMRIQKNVSSFQKFCVQLPRDIYFHATNINTSLLLFFITISAVRKVRIKPKQLKKENGILKNNIFFNFKVLKNNKIFESFKINK